MNQEEIKKLAIECGLVNGVDVESTFLDWKKEIEDYTAAVEARERERCADICQSYRDEWARLKVGAYDGRYDMMEEAASMIDDEIRELK